ncbi:hypothetical protein BLTE_05650 [Blastochloris tepida]|uniref:Uncharacterized protein n=1 Tax=Blastochloris tepida TaxID=2233851 RepID=A0A348FX47_9HYPH|nr:hypothetical protein BLTE_05650 [Blastochloris tepida]
MVIVALSSLGRIVLSYCLAARWNIPHPFRVLKDCTPRATAKAAKHCPRNAAMSGIIQTLARRTPTHLTLCEYRDPPTKSTAGGASGRGESPPDGPRCVRCLNRLVSRRSRALLRDTTRDA